MYQALLTGRASPLQNKREILEQLSLLMCLRMKGSSLWQQWGPAVARLSMKTAVCTAKSHLLLCNYCKKLFTHCVEEKDGLTFSSVFFQSINGINFSLKRMSDKKGAYGKIFLLQRNIHRTACAQNCAALTPHVQQNPRLKWHWSGQGFCLSSVTLEAVDVSGRFCLQELGQQQECVQGCVKWSFEHLYKSDLHSCLGTCPSALITPIWTLLFFLVYFGIFAATIQSCCLLFFCYVPLSNACLFPL